MRPIAMRMTQEQFESIEHMINLPIFSLSQLESFPVFINYSSGRYAISNASEDLAETLDAGKEYHKTFNADVFLEACGVEVEKVWKAEELQWKATDENWYTFVGDFKIRIKPQPNYDKEIEALQQKAKENGMKVIINFEKI